jgi:NAD(P)-dependent dehydrogenase (short-subunit alcohol dehydrogenase family)
VFAGVRKQADAAALQEQASQRLTQLYLDVTRRDTIASAAEVVAAAVGDTGLAGLINNAGVAVGGPLEFLPTEALQRQLEINVVGQVAVTQAFLPLLRMGHGRIVNMGSVSGRVAMPFMGPYSASKFALGALTDSLRVELYPWNIQVSIVEPGAIDTPIWEKSLKAADKMAETWSPQVHALYGPAMNAARQAAVDASRSAIPVDKVVDAVTHALTAKHPKTRYLIGRGTWVAALIAKFMSDRVRDRVILQRRSRNKT